MLRTDFKRISSSLSVAIFRASGGACAWAAARPSTSVLRANIVGVRRGEDGGERMSAATYKLLTSNGFPLSGVHKVRLKWKLLCNDLVSTILGTMIYLFRVRKLIRGLKYLSYYCKSVKIHFVYTQVNHNMLNYRAF